MPSAPTHDILILPDRFYFVGTASVWDPMLLHGPCSLPRGAEVFQTLEVAKSNCVSHNGQKVYIVVGV